MSKSLVPLKLENNPTLYITKEIQSDITTLHSAIGSTEWSGILFYEITKGSVKNLSTLELTARKVYLMDIGTAGGTGFDYGADCAKAYDDYPDALKKWKEGFIHTHHSMKAYFSGTDKEELQDNSDKYNFYLSLVVNFSSEFDAVLAIPCVNSQQSFDIHGADGKVIKTKVKQEDHIMTVNCDIKFTHDGPFVQRILDVKEAKKVAAAAKIPKYVPSHSLGARTPYYNNTAMYANTPGAMPDIVSIRSFMACALMLDAENKVPLGTVQSFDPITIAGYAYEAIFETHFDTLFEETYGTKVDSVKLGVLYTIKRIVGAWGPDVDMLIHDSFEGSVEMMIEELKEKMDTLRVKVS